MLHLVSGISSLCLFVDLFSFISNSFIPSLITSSSFDSLLCYKSIITPSFTAGLKRLPDTSAPRHFGIRTVWHAEVSRDNSALDFYWCRTVRTLRRQCRNTSRHFGTIRQNIWAIVLFCQNRPTISTICRDLPILQLVK